MRLLLDTHAFLWWRLDAPNLALGAKAMIGDPENEVFVSSVVGWEIVIKRALGRLTFVGSVLDAVREEGFSSLDVSLRHTDGLSALPLLHRDPFDRLLVVQARTEGMALVTRDDNILAYEGFVAVWDR